MCHPFKYWVDDYRVKTVPCDYYNRNNVVNRTPNLEKKSKTCSERDVKMSKLNKFIQKSSIIPDVYIYADESRSMFRE